MALPKLPSVPTKTTVDFIRERRYLKNVTAKTLTYYDTAFKAFKECETLPQYNHRIMELQERGIKPISINTWIKAVNAYFHWRQDNAPMKCSPACPHLKLQKLKMESKIIHTLTPAQIKTLLTSRPKCVAYLRIQALAALLLDTGLRVSESLTLRRADIDLEQLTVKVMGKGRKERHVPISLEGRKWMHTWLFRLQPHDYAFATNSGSAMSVRNCGRDLTLWSRKCGIKVVRCSPHTLRHTFAVSYLRTGGNLEYLRRILGHSSIITTQQYLKSLSPEDLVKVHGSFSALATMA